MIRWPKGLIAARRSSVAGDGGGSRGLAAGAKARVHALEAAGFSALRRGLCGVARDATARVAGRRTLVVAPHPDDETLGCGGVIARLRRSGAVVRVLIVTDGRESHQSALISSAALVRLRAEEALAACARLGVAAEEVCMLAFPDGGLAAAGTALAARLAREINAFHPEQIFYPSGIDAHPDHRAVAEAVELWLRKTPQRPPAYAYPVWLWKVRPWISRPSFIFGALRLKPVKISTSGCLQQKRDALAAHRSQLENLTGEPGWETLQPSFLAHFLGRFELFFEL